MSRNGQDAGQDKSAQDGFCGRQGQNKDEAHGKTKPQQLKPAVNKPPELPLSGGIFQGQSYPVQHQKNGKKPRNHDKITAWTSLIIKT
ncbi:MAG: hypothetical protein AB1Z38_09390 [Desulfotignum sp.]